MSVAPVVDFFYGIGSRYSYLASTQVDRLAGETSATFRWRPLSLSDLMNARGQNPFAGKAPSGQYDWDYRRADAEAWAAYYGVPFRDDHDRVTYDPRLLSRACTAAGRLGRVADYSKALFRAMFVDDIATIDRAECVRRAESLGLDPPRYAALLDDPAIDSATDANLADARARGVFGVPTFILGDRLFWGNDRLVLLRHALMGTTRHQGTAAPS